MRHVPPTPTLSPCVRRVRGACCVVVTPPLPPSPSLPLSLWSCCAQHLATVPLLKNVEAADLSRLADVMTTADVEDGEYIVEIGDAADVLFLVLMGEVVCHREGGDKELLRLSQGQFFGEVSTHPQALRSRPRTHSCTPPHALVHAPTRTRARRATARAARDPPLLRLVALAPWRVSHVSLCLPRPRVSLCLPRPPTRVWHVRVRSCAVLPSGE
jgi:hypothetical protein